ncbi:PH domain-containing protein [Mobiluncus mulieris]|uniref:PH domain-containing protein n=1 Tax=Mobiluncus mulieris TaxID=2052 RepID=A0ABD4TYL2_9ACTO|nr:PH domain-containing protein [Mobiluncus mulieris]MCU9969075.1 PH domain-containing protein [Mobiluncus mulieris]MCU9973564.1 PH domain-containing protein [Mobiluncus mulieris]MCV0009497.1 PH domain-containing protein [Mobiluncus mulieris]NMW75332.1 PH domain-containing protein [Mobiluncus mulieris]NMX01458.1 PH domain-containing protein [Mobiluncus mulieris]
MDADIFNPAGVKFKPISLKSISARYIVLFIWIAVIAIAIALGAFFSHQPLIYTAEAVPAVLLIWRMWLIPRQVRAWGYAEGEKDLYIRRGIMFKKMWAVPYGRMQFVDVTQGPIDRMFGIADVSLKTASAESDASIPGLPREEADRVRVILTERGEALRAGL